MPSRPRSPGTADIAYLMAAESEYGLCLRARLTPIMTGVGPVEAAVNVTHALGLLAHKGRLPALVVSLGSAGSRTLERGSVHQASSVAYRDMDASILGFEPGRTPFLDGPAIIPMAPLVPGLAQARLSTGAKVISGAGYDGIDADMVDMETYAIKRAADRFHVPLIAIRGISDGEADLAGFSDWTRYLHIVDENLAHAVDVLEAALAKGLFL